MSLSFDRRELLLKFAAHTLVGVCGWTMLTTLSLRLGVAGAVFLLFQAAWWIGETIIAHKNPVWNMDRVAERAKGYLQWCGVIAGATLLTMITTGDRSLDLRFTFWVATGTYLLFVNPSVRFEWNGKYLRSPTVGEGE